MNKYKTFEELKEELGDKFEEYMYKANIELLNKLDKIKEYIKEEIEEYEKGQLLYKDLGRELEQYMKGQLVAYEHIEKILKGSDK